MKLLWTTALALTASGGLLASTAFGQPAPDKARGEAVFNARCKECHEPAVDRAPSREELAAKKPEDIVAALTTGPMAPIAEGLTSEDKQAVAAYLAAH